MSPAEKARRPLVQESEFHKFKRRLSLSFLGRRLLGFSVLNLRLWLGTKCIVNALELEFRLLERSQDIVFHVEGTNACQFTSHSQLLADHQVVIGVGSQQPVAVEEFDGDGGVGGDAVVQGDHEAITIIFRLDDGESSDATDKGKCLQVRVVHLN